jgi:molecular chaperone DnaK (HSP70)
MRRFGIDFGTSNSVLAVWNDTLDRPETLEVPGLSRRLTCRLEPGGPELATWVVPSVIHYGEKQVLVGQQVIDAVLYEHPWTMRFFKRDIGRNNTNNSPTGQGPKTAQEAGRDFLLYVFNRLEHSATEDTFTFTAPCEAFEHYHEWLGGVLESLGLVRVRYLDEPTACILGCHGQARQDQRFGVFDFGCGTLDLSVVRVDFNGKGHRMAVVCGEAGADLGGMDLDGLLRDDFTHLHLRDSPGREQLKALVLCQAEEAKIALSEPGAVEAEMAVADGDRRRAMRCVASCERCAVPNPTPVQNGHTPGCLGCLMRERRVRFLPTTEATIARALKNAWDQERVSPAELEAVFVTGGTSLIPAVRALLELEFPGKVRYRNPFDAVAQGACRGLTVPKLLHDYALESHDPKTGKPTLVPLFRAGTVFPTDTQEVWAQITFDGQTEIVPKVFEVSHVPKRSGLFRREHAHDGGLDGESTWINRTIKTRIVPDPPAVKARDAERFLCQFSINTHKHLLLTVRDCRTGRTMLERHMVVRL